MTQLTCPIPIGDYPRVLLAHGGGGRLSLQLVEKMLHPSFENQIFERLHDGAVLSLERGRLAFTTDSYVVHPLFFPGGDIGRLSVHGTANDLAMCGAHPLFISCGLILEEGLPMEDLWRVVVSIRETAFETGVQVITGDTKVVEKGKGDGVFINTSGIGMVLPGLDIGLHRLRPGDEVLISGPIGLHGIAIMALREGLELETEIMSDTASVYPLVEALAVAGLELHMLRDPTRGGVSAALNEMARHSGVGILIDEDALPIPTEVEGVCEILGLDPLYVANEGNFLAVVAEGQGVRALEAMRRHPLGSRAALIGRVEAEHAGVVVMKTRIGGERVVDMMSGEQLPRIC
jgi:hydrogenase expression/formation protein HypE